MSESEKKYHCEECKKELSTSFVRLHKMLYVNYMLKMQNNKLVEFVLKISKDCGCIGYNCNCLNYFSSEAKELLKEIGEV